MRLRSYVTTPYVSTFLRHSDTLPDGRFCFRIGKSLGAVGRSGCWLVPASIVGVMQQARSNEGGSRAGNFLDLRETK